MAMHDEWMNRLSELLDDELAPADRLTLERHLEGCATCRETLASLRTVIEHAHTLTDTAPVHDLWPGIAEKIAPPQLHRRISFSWPQLVAASLFIALVGGVFTLMIVDRRSNVASIADEPSTVALRPRILDDPTSDRAAAELLDVLNANRHNLSPRTIQTVERSLATIDRAIAAAKAALEQDPNNLYFADHLARERRLKLAVLRRVSTFAEVTQ